MLVVLHEDASSQSFDCRYLDGGAHTAVWRSVAKNLHDEPEDFEVMFDALTSHSDTDRWSRDELNNLSRRIPKIQSHIDSLLNQPKDGALLLSHTGSVKLAAVHVGYASDTLCLQKIDGKSTGTRHASSLGFAEWIGTHLPNQGVIMVRSDAGGAHAFLPHSCIPEAFEFKTLHVPTQVELLTLFKARIMRDGLLMRSVHPKLIRPAKKNEEVVTVVDGKVTGQKIITEESDYYVVRSCTVEQEQYVLHKSQVEHHYEVPGIDLDTIAESHLVNQYFLQTQAKDLKQLGFTLYSPKPDELRWMYTVTQKDLLDVPAKCFLTTYGATQSLKEGTLLAVPAPESRAVKIYCISRQAAASFVPADWEDSEIARKDGSNASSIRNSSRRKTFNYTALNQLRKEHSKDQQSMSAVKEHL